MSRRTYRLPNRNLTQSAVQLEREWLKIAKPFTDMGFKIIGFDPGYLLDYNGEVIDLSVDLVKLLGTKIKEANSGKAFIKDAKKGARELAKT